MKSMNLIKHANDNENILRPDIFKSYVDVVFQVNTAEDCMMTQKIYIGPFANHLEAEVWLRKFRNRFDAVWPFGMAYGSDSYSCLIVDAIPAPAHVVEEMIHVIIGSPQNYETSEMMVRLPKHIESMFCRLHTERYTEGLEEPEGGAP